MLACVFTGLSSGFPLYVLFQLVPAWLRTEGVDLATIGLFSLILLPYNWKFIWAPLMDRYVPPFLGRRTGWMLLTQVSLLFSIAFLGFIQPSNSIGLIAYICFVVAFFSASQDIVLDAYRRELLEENELGLGNTIHVQAYRIAGLIPGALGLILADHFDWDVVFMIIAAFMSIGIMATFLYGEKEAKHTPKTLRDAVIEPFADFINRNSWRGAGLILVFMFFYKLGDNMATALQTPFLIDLGFSHTTIGLVAKNAALWGAIAGGVLGGIWMLKLGINRALWLFGAVQIVTIFGFAMLSEAGSNTLVLGIVLTMEYVGVGLGTAAFVAYIARSTTPAFAATQLALLTAISVLPRTFASASSGFIVEAIGYTTFFYLCMVLAIPGMLLLFKVAPWTTEVDVVVSRDDSS
ncbi:MAG: AmpG family muropeptide MFS transporter [Gammaproteobacteria bacterium]|nr:AmpG family muropeptide MFS transporter [Gammaproteobacteria bacterium]